MMQPGMIGSREVRVKRWPRTVWVERRRGQKGGESRVDVVREVNEGREVAKSGEAVKSKVKGEEMAKRSEKETKEVGKSGEEVESREVAQSRVEDREVAKSEVKMAREVDKGREATESEVKVAGGVNMDGEVAKSRIEGGEQD